MEELPNHSKEAFKENTDESKIDEEEHDKPLDEIIEGIRGVTDESKHEDETMRLLSSSKEERRDDDSESDV